LVKKRRRRRHYAHPGVVPPTTHRPNDLWTADFKGHFRTRDGLYCYPLTVADQHTRYLLGCQGLLSTKGQGVRPIFDRLFREYGLPGAIRTDNGVPFATTGIHGLSQLNVWWMRLGIQHQRILPASPQQNGAHERMHRTLKAATARPPQSHLPAPQRAFNRGSASSTTRNARINFSEAGRPRRCTGRRPVRTRGTSHPSSTRAITFPSG
jgi:putative transposase